MNKHIDEKDKLTIVARYLKGTPIADMRTELGIPRSTLYLWAQKYREADFNDISKIPSTNILQRKCERLERIIEILQKAPYTVRAPLKDRLKVIECMSAEYRTNYRSEKELKKSLAEYMRFYNNDKPHDTLQYKSPNKFEELYYKHIKI